MRNSAPLAGKVLALWAVAFLAMHIGLIHWSVSASQVEQKNALYLKQLSNDDSASAAVRESHVDTNLLIGLAYPAMSLIGVGIVCWAVRKEIKDRAFAKWLEEVRASGTA